jgi:DnaJ-class molecular chaperone
MGYKRIRRLVMVTCTNCLGSGTIMTKSDKKKCPDCKGSGEVEKWIVEIVNEDE